MSDNWELFLKIVGEDLEIINSPLYRLLIDHFPIPFMLKLLSDVNFSSSLLVQRNAALLLRYHFGDILDERYTSLDTKTLKSFQTQAIYLLRSQPSEPLLKRCAQDIAAKLLSLSLQRNEKWSGFLEWTKRAFTSDRESLDSILEIYCKQKVLLQHKLMVLLAPSLRMEHFDLLLDLLAEGEDYKPFVILPSISYMLKRDRWSKLMEDAILSPFFDKQTDPLRKCQVASSLRFCIQHSVFDFSLLMIDKIRSIIELLLQSRHNKEQLMAVKLCAALLASCFPESMRELES